MVQLVIANLYDYIIQDLGYTIRVCDDDIPLSTRLSEMLRFTSATNIWGSMCDTILQAYPNVLLPAPGILWSITIYILPLSPPTATISATDRMAFNSEDRFAEHWTGFKAPDIAINIQDPTNTIRQGEVLRLNGKKTLSKTQGGSISFTHWQLGRVIVEVGKWLRIA